MTATADRWSPRLALGASEALRPFNEAGIIDAADVHVAERTAALVGETDAHRLLAAALACRAVRHGHLRLDLRTVADTAAADTDDVLADPASLEWPEPDAWAQRLAGSPLFATDGQTAEPRPFRLEGTHVYLDRYWREECQVAEDLLRIAASPPAEIAVDALDDGLARLFPGDEADPGSQALAARTALTRNASVIAGGPGTGKTTTVARVLALLHEQARHAGLPEPRVALAAPTGKAAARLAEAIAGEADRLDTAPEVRAHLCSATATTLHRLLGWRWDTPGRFRHHRGNHLPHDAVIVDEGSMVSLTMMARLLEAVGDRTRLVLVGDPNQLASVEAGAVLGDVVADADKAATGRGADLAAGIVTLTRVHRFGGRIADLAAAIDTGDADAVLAVLRDGGDEVVFEERVEAADAPVRGVDAPPAVRQSVVAAGMAVSAAARAGDAAGALDALSRLRVLCAHRRGPHGARTWASAVEWWLRSALPGYGGGHGWYPGRPLLVTGNDYSLELFNGDTGVVVEGPDGRPVAVFERGGAVLSLAPTRLADVETVHAMTIHKSQGSQFREVVVVLPEPTSPILTRELLYTAVTRATQRVTVVGREAAVRTAVERPIARASGLRERLYGS